MRQLHMAALAMVRSSVMIASDGNVVHKPQGSVVLLVDVSQCCTQVVGGRCLGLRQLYDSVVFGVQFSYRLLVIEAVAVLPLPMSSDSNVLRFIGLFENEVFDVVHESLSSVEFGIPDLPEVVCSRLGRTLSEGAFPIHWQLRGYARQCL